jgi:hypothetical protein
LPNNIVLLVTIDKFDPNPILVNINKLKPYRFFKDRTLRSILANFSDLIIDEHVQITKLETLIVENDNSKLVEFEPINNYLTHGSIFGTYVLVHYHDDVPIEFNYVPIRND